MRAWRPGRLVLALLALLGAWSPARAQPCPTLPAAVMVEPVILAITATGERRPHHALLRGALLVPANMPDSALRQIDRGGLCGAALGEITIDGTRLCTTFGREFGSLDRVERAGPRISFDLHADVPRRWNSDYLDIAVAPSPDRCAPRATFLVAGSGDQEITTVPLLADRMANGRVTWTEAQWGPAFARELAIGVRQRSAAATDRASIQSGDPTLNPPRSWAAYARGEVLDTLLGLLWVPLYVLVIVGGFMHFGGALLYAEAKPPLAAVVKALTAAVALYAAARWTGAALDLARLMSSAQAREEGGRTEEIFGWLSLGQADASAWIVAAIALVTPLVLLLWTATLIVGAPRAGATLFRHSLRLAVRALAVASLLAWLFLAAAALAARLLPDETPFEPVALAVSLALAVWAVWSFEPVTGLGWRRGLLAVIAITLLLLYPHPVVQGSEPPSAVDNALAWFPYAGGYFVPNAMLLTVALVAALKIARSRGAKRNSIEFDRTLLFLFGFSVGLASIGSLTSAILLFAVLAAADRLLFPREAAAEADADAAEEKGPRPRVIRPPRLALGVAVIAAAVFWLQYSGDLLAGGAGARGLLLPAMLIYAAAVPAAIGGLLLQHSFVRLPGPIAAGKALVITAFAFAVSVATRLPLILAERSILPAVIDVLGIFTALVATAILLYDGPQARAGLGGKNLKDKLAGSGFGWFLTILSSVSLAAASALSPILYGELGTVFRSVVRERLGTASAGAPQGSPTAP